MDVDSDFSEEYENSPSPAPAKAKKAAAKKSVLGPSNTQNVVAGGQGGKALEEIYQKKSQLEHILLRPDTYIGSTEKQQQQLWIHDGSRMVLQNVQFVPGLYKIFDEILVNAADNKVRDASMDTVRVHIDPEANSIQVWNNGNGIPVEIHKEEQVYVPELIFGHLLTSSNYDDNEKKITGGRNGYGAKLANIFSTEFILETCDGQRQRRYRQVFTNNMTVKAAPKISSCKASDNWTCVTFKPDLAKFGMDHLEADTVALMRKRVYDLAGILGKACKVYLNGERLSIKSFQEYVELYLGPKDSGPPRVYERVNDRWEVCISPTDGQFNQVSFVNSICTMKGGTHVNYVVDQLTKSLVEKINKKNKHANVKPFMVKNHLWLFINCSIENPAFDSQTKENLTLRASSFGSKCELPQTYIDKVAKSGLVDSILQFATFKNNKELKKGDGAKRQRILGIPKLDDANDAGGRNSHLCTLILTEGDSAKALAISGLSVVGRDHYGVFPLRGKLLNVRDASAAQITGNAEIQALKQILGLQHGKTYDDVKSLRYGHLMLMTDQDHDGSHIKGLIMNFLHAFYPSLLKIPGFLMEFITPIIKASKGKQRKVFYTMPEYEAWKESLGSTAGWSIKYYKGLGTSTREEAREYFSAIDYHRKRFTWASDGDGGAIEMAFSKKKVEDRKEWLSAFQPGTFLDSTASTITYSDFIHKELILFSRADLERSIPCMVDGLKPGQRKIMFACFKRNLKKDIKVAQLAGYVSEHAAYHHGEQSLASTIINLAQDFVGSNNINLLMPSGQFGTRLQGGKDAASSRYIFTRMAPLTRHLFNESDDRLLAYLNEEGQSIEPEWYIPILPMVLVNGAEGIGTGWSTFIPNFNPRDIVDNIKRLMQGLDMEPMQPWYRSFRGSITEVVNKSGGKSYACAGVVNQVNESRLEITELPIRKWTQDYKEYLEGLVRPEEKTAEAPLLVDYKEHHTDVSVHFIVDVASDRMHELTAAGVETKLKLVNKFSTGNMMLFDASGSIKHYPSPEAIIQEFYGLRLDYYERRRKALLKSAQGELLRLSNRVRFILAVISGELVVSNRKKAAVEADLQAAGYDKLPTNNAKARSAGDAPTDDEGEGGEGAAAPTSASYDYLLSMPIYSLTLEKVQALQAASDEQEAEVARLAASTAEDMWSTDLDAFLEAYSAWEAEEEAAVQQLMRQGNKARVGSKAASKAATKKLSAGKAKKASRMSDSDEDEGDWDSDDVMDEDDDDDYVEKKPKAPPRPPAAPRAAPASKAPSSTAAAAGKAASTSAAGKPSGSTASGATAKASGSGAAPKPAAGAAAPKARAAPAPKASAQPSTSSAASGEAAAPSEPLSLAARLAGRFQKLTMATTSSAGPSHPHAPAVPGASAHLDDDDDDLVMDQAGTLLEASAESPAPALLKARGKTAGGVAASKPAAQPAKRKPAAPKAPAEPKAAAAGASKAAGKPAAAKPRKKRVVSDSEEEESDVSDMSEEEEDSDNDSDVFLMEAPSPAVAPKGKKSKVGPSPITFKKTTSKTGGAAKPKAAAPPAPAAPAVAAVAAEEDAGTAGGDAAGRPQRTRRPAAKDVSYIEILEDSEEDNEDEESSGSEFSGSEDDDE